MPKIVQDFNKTRDCKLSFPNVEWSGVDDKTWQAKMTPIKQMRLTRNRVIMQHAQTAVSSAAQLDAFAKERHLTQFLADMGEFVTVKPNEANLITGVLARWFDVNTGTPGAVKQDFNEMAKLVTAQLHMTGRLAGISKITELDIVLQDLFPGMSRIERGRIAYDAIEIGGVTREGLAAGQTAAMQVFNRARYDHYAAKLQAMGLNPTQIDILNAAASDVANIFHEVTLVAEAMGVHVGRTEGIGYINRAFTKDASLRLKDVLSGDAMVDFSSVGEHSLSTMLANSRQHNWLVPEDVFLFGEITGLTEGKVFTKTSTDGFQVTPNRIDLSNIDDPNHIGAYVQLPPNANTVQLKTKAGETARQALKDWLYKTTKPNKTEKIAFEQLWNDPDPSVFVKHVQGSLQGYDAIVIDVLDSSDKLTGTSLLNINGKMTDLDMQKQIVELMTDPVAFHEFVRTRLSQTQRDMMEELGILSKVPMSNMEVYQYYTTKYNWTDFRPEDFLVFDLEELVTRQRESLAHAAKTSGFIKGITSDEGVKAGWTVKTNSPEYLANKEYFDANWVPITDKSTEQLRARQTSI